MIMKTIKENVCPVCTESGCDKSYIDREGYCKHVKPRHDGTYIYYKENEEEEE